MQNFVPGWWRCSLEWILVFSQIWRTQRLWLWGTWPWTAQVSTGAQPAMTWERKTAPLRSPCNVRLHLLPTCALMDCSCFKLQMEILSLFYLLFHPHLFSVLQHCCVSLIHSRWGLQDSQGHLCRHTKTHTYTHTGTTQKFEAHRLILCTAVKVWGVLIWKGNRMCGFNKENKEGSNQPP